MAYTATYLNATAPLGGAMPTIGSVSANFWNSSDSNNSTTSDELLDLLYSTKEAESIRATYGDIEYDEFIEEKIKKRNQKAEKLMKMERKKLKRRNSAPKGAVRRWITELGFKIADAYREGV